MKEARIFIHKGREKPIINQHPWIFSGAIARIEGEPKPGDIVSVRAHDGAFLARGYWNPRSQIQVRILSWEDEPIDDIWWKEALGRAIHARAVYNRHAQEEAIAYRLINAENDFIPGLIVDRYGDWLVLQALTLGIDQRKDVLARLIAEILPCKGIYERSDVDVRGKEGLKQETGLLYGEEPPDLIEIVENGRILLNVRTGHKTGYYLDQAPSRALVFDIIGAEFDGECSLLNLFSYTGGFGVAALAAGGVKVTNVDSSMDALQLAEKIAELNGYDAADAEYIQADVFEFLRDQEAEGASYDIVVLDPPKFAHNKGQVESAARGYKDINLNALKLVKPGGLLLTFSCSGAISADLFQKIVFGALADSGRQAQIIRHLGPGADHPVALSFPEGAYLKGLLLRVF